MVRWFVVFASFLTGCGREIEKMAPPVWAKGDPLASATQASAAEPEMDVLYEEVDTNADVVINVVVRGGRDDQVVRHSIPMKRRLVPKGYQSGRLGEAIADALDDEGQVRAALHVSINPIDVSDALAKVSVYVAWISRADGDVVCDGEVQVEMGRSTKKTVKGGCAVRATYRSLAHRAI